MAVVVPGINLIQFSSWRSSLPRMYWDAAWAQTGGQYEEHARGQKLCTIANNETQSIVYRHCGSSDRSSDRRADGDAPKGRAHRGGEGTAARDQWNNDGVQEMRAAIPTEIENVSQTVALLEQREAGHAVDGSQVKVGLAVMSFTNANWQTASVTGAMSSIDYDTVERFAGAYFEQARLAQLQTSTMESMMSLSSYVGHGKKLQSMSPEEARAAEIQAQALLAHLKMMSRMTEGVQDAYKKALGS
jgi:hypothetical protein